MNTSNIFLNSTNTVSTLIIRPIRKNYVKSPFDSWYIGGILFMCSVMFVLLYANYYRENACQICWIRILTKLRIMPPLPTNSSPSSLHRMEDPFLI